MQKFLFLILSFLFILFPLKPLTVSAEVLPYAPYIQIATGFDHTLVLDNNGQVFAFGYNTKGQLGDGTNNDTATPLKVSISGLATGDKVVQIAVGEYTSYALTSQGRLFAWGVNNKGQLASNVTTTPTSNVPLEITFSTLNTSKIIQVTATHRAAFALTNDGRIFSWGTNDSGSLGNAQTASSLSSSATPLEITTKGQFSTLVSPDKIVALYSGFEHVIAVSSTKRVFGWGSNYFGEVTGTPGTTTATKQINAPTEITTLFNSFSLAGDDSLKSFALGFQGSIALTQKGRIFSWGLNANGGLGTGTFSATVASAIQEITTKGDLVNLDASDYITSIAYRDNSTFAISSTGRVFAFGKNTLDYLGLGNGDRTNPLTPLETTSKGEFSTLTTGEKVIQITTLSVSLALTDQGRIYSWGTGKMYATGSSTTSDAPKQITTNGALAEFLVSSVINAINAISSPVTLADATTVTNARTAYDALTTAQKPLVSNYSKLTDAEATIADLSTVQSVVDQITALSNPITLADKTAVSSARTAYDALTTAQKANVTNYATLTAAESEITNLETIKAVVDQITALPTTITLADQTAIEAARTSYDALTEDQKTAVTNYDTLVSAETAFDVLFAPIDAVIAQIAALNSPVSLTDETAIDAVRTAYDALTTAEKALVSNYSDLTTAETDLLSLQTIQAVIDEIDALPSTITLADKATIEAARASYDALTANQQLAVTNYSKLVNAKSAYDGLMVPVYTVIGKINALNTPIALTDESAIVAARSAYDALTAEEKALVSNYSDLTADEAALDSLKKVKAVVDQITALPATIALTDETAIVAARSAYDALTAEEKALVTNYSDLTADENKIVNLKAANTVINQISSLPSTVTLTDETAIVAARTAYDALTTEQKSLVTNYSDLTADEAALASLKKVKAVVDQINALPSRIDLTDEPAIVEARTAYDALTTEQKSLVTNYSDLTADEAALASLKTVKAVVDQINALPSTIDLTDEPAIVEARTAYDALTDTEKNAVTNYDQLVAKENLLKVRTVESLIAAIPSTIDINDETDITDATAAYDGLTTEQKALVSNTNKLNTARKGIAIIKFVQTVGTENLSAEDKATLQQMLNDLGEEGKSILGESTLATIDELVNPSNSYTIWFILISLISLFGLIFFIIAKRNESKKGSSKPA